MPRLQAMIILHLTLAVPTNALCVWGVGGGVGGCGMPGDVSVPRATTAYTAKTERSKVNLAVSRINTSFHRPIRDGDTQKVQHYLYATLTLEVSRNLAWMN